MAKLTQHIDRLNTTLGTVKDVKPSVDTSQLEQGSQKAQGIAGSLQSALSRLSGGTVNLDVSQLQAAGGSANKVLSEVRGGLLNVGSVSTLAGAGIAAFATGAAVQIIRLGEQYDRAFRQIAASTGESGAALEGLNASLLKISQTSPKGIGDLGQQVAIVTQRLNEQGPALESTVGLINKYSQATGSDAVVATGELARAFNAFKVAVDEQGPSLDALVRVSQTTGISQAQLRQELIQFGPTLRGFGLSIQESAALLGIFDKNGIEASQVMVGLKRALGDLGGPDAKEKLLDLITALGKMEDQTQASKDAIQLFGARAGPALLDAARSGKITGDTIAAALDGAAGSSKRASDSLISSMDGIQKSLHLLERAFAPVGIAAVEAANRIAGEFVGALSGAGQAIDAFLASEAVRQAANIANNVPGIVKTGVSIAAGPVAQVAGAVAGAATSLPGGSPAAQEADAEDRRAKALNAVKVAQDAAADSGKDYNAIVTDAVVAASKGADGMVNYAVALKRAGDNTAVIEPILLLQKSFSDLDKAIGEVTDTGLQAFLVGQKNAALATKDTAEQQRILSGALGLANENLDEGKRIAEENSKANTAAAKAVADVESAMAKAAQEGGTLYNKRLDDLATGILPNLTAAETVHLRQMQDVGDQAGILALLAEKYGTTEENLSAILGSTNAVFAERQKQLAAVAKGYDGILTDEFKSRIDGVLGTLIKDTDLATAAMIKGAQETGHGREALEAYLRTMGFGDAEVKRFFDGIVAGSQQAKTELDRLAAAQQAANSQVLAGRPTQGSPNPVDQAVNAMQAGVQQAQQAYQAAQTQLAQSAAQSQEQFATAVATAQKSQASASREFQTTYTNIALARDTLNSQTEAAIATANDKLASATRDLEAKRVDLFRKFQEAVADAHAKFNDSVATAVEHNRETVAGLFDAVAQAQQHATEASRQALLSFANTMAGVIAQTIQSANQDSINLAAIQAKQLLGGGAADQSALATQLTQLQAQQGFAAVAAQRQIDQARQGLVDAQNSSVADAGRAATKAQQDAEKATKDLNKTIGDAAKTYQKTTDDLAKQFQEQTKALNVQADQASSTALRAIQAAEDARAKQLKALEEQQRQALEKRDQAIVDAQEAIRKAEQDRTKRDAKLNEQQKDAEDKFLKARADAQKAVTELLRKLPETTAEAIAARIQLSPHQFFAGARIVNQETGVDFVRQSVGRLADRVRSGV